MNCQLSGSSEEKLSAEKKHLAVCVCVYVCVFVCVSHLIHQYQADNYFVQV